MNCSCCGRKKKLFESYETIDNNINICIDCSQLLYRIRDASNAHDFSTVSLLKKQLSQKSANKMSDDFQSWYNQFCINNGC